MRARWMLATGLALNLAALTFAAICMEPLQFDGIMPLAHLLRRHHTYIGARHRLETLLQLPAVALDHLVPGDSIRPQTLAFCLSYCLHPFLSLAACAWICARAGAPFAFLFPALSFATASQLAMTFAVGAIPVSLDIFWPVLLAQVLLPPSSRASRVSAALGAAALVFTHPWAMILELALLASTLARWDEDRKSWPGKEIAFRAVLFGSGFLILFYLAFFRDGAPSTDYPAPPWAIFSWISIGVALVLPLLWVLAREARRPATLVVALGVIGYAVALQLRPGDLASPFPARAARVLAIPVAAWLGLTLHLARSRLPIGWWRDARLWRHASACVAVLLSLSALHTWVQTRTWNRGLTNFRWRLLSQKQPCGSLPKKEYTGLIGGAGINGTSAVFFSAFVLGTRRPNRVLAAEPYDRDDLYVTFCKRASAGEPFWANASASLDLPR